MGTQGPSQHRWTWAAKERELGLPVPPQSSLQFRGDPTHQFYPGFKVVIKVHQDRRAVPFSQQLVNHIQFCIWRQ